MIPFCIYFRGEFKKKKTKEAALRKEITEARPIYKSKLNLVQKEREFLETQMHEKKTA